MNVRGERSSVMAKLLAKDAAIYPWNVCMPQIVVPVASRTPSKYCSAIGTPPPNPHPNMFLTLGVESFG